MPVFKDQTGRIVTLSETPRRIVSLVPSQTELLCSLGLEACIVGVTKFCVHPDYIKKNSVVVGGTKQVRLKKIKELKPDIILCNKEENTKEMVGELQQIAPVHVSDIFTVNDSLQLISQYGEIFDCEQKAGEIRNDILQKYTDHKAALYDEEPKKVAYFIWKDPWMVAANDTFIDHLLALNKYQNVFSGLKRYPEISKAQLKDIERPDVIFLSSEPYPFKEEHIKEVNELFEGVQVKLVDGEYFSWYGSRLSEAFVYFTQLRKQLQ